MAADVVVVHWPEHHDEVKRLADQRVPRLLLVAPAADPPEGGDLLQDWVRLPGDERDVRARLSGLRRLAAELDRAPVVDQHGRLALRVHLHRLRRLVTPLGLEIRGAATRDGCCW